MNKRTLEALRGSIKKWDDIAERDGEDHGWENCALCRLFNTAPSGVERCNGCPVYSVTRLTGCNGTPYVEWENYRSSFGVSAVTQHDREIARQDWWETIRNFGNAFPAGPLVIGSRTFWRDGQPAPIN